MTESVHLPNLTGDKYTKNKGDLFKIPMRCFKFYWCISPEDISKISIVADSNDEWNINSIVATGITFIGVDKFLSADINVYKWIDSDGSDADKRFDLQLLI